MPIGVVASSGGGVFAAAVDVLRVAGRTPDFRVVTDRACGMETVCARLDVPCVRVEEPDRSAFSARAATQLYDTWGCTWSVLFFTRLVDAPLYETRPCVNLHPSLLPAYPGLRPLAEALADGAPVFGATAHRVDAGLDTGPIVAQIAWPMPRAATLPELQRLSFAQKLHLLLALVEADGALPPFDGPIHAAAPWARPMLREPALVAAYHALLAREGIEAPWAAVTAG